MKMRTESERKRDLKKKEQKNENRKQEKKRTNEEPCSIFREKIVAVSPTEKQ